MRPNPGGYPAGSCRYVLAGSYEAEVLDLCVAEVHFEKGADYVIHARSRATRWSPGRNDLRAEDCFPRTKGCERLQALHVGPVGPIQSRQNIGAEGQ